MSSFDDPANLDPIYLQADDPLMEFLPASVAGIQPTESHNLGTDSDPLDNHDDDLPVSIQNSARGDNSFSVSSPTNSGIAAIGQVIKRIKKFEGKFETEFDNYCTTANVEERLAMHFAVDLKILEILNQMQKPDNWVISSDLNKTIILYTKAMLLSPTLKSYRGNLAKHILKAMRDLNVADLPSEKHVLQVNEVLSAIGTALTAQRNTIKTKIAASLEPDGKLRNIADLTHDLVQGARMQSTLQHYMRFAFLRWLVKKFPKDPNLWEKVDSTLEKYRKAAVTEAALTASFNACYQQDKNTYGDPANSIHDAVEPNNVDDWTRSINKYAGTIHPSAVAQSQKRKRNIQDDED